MGKKKQAKPIYQSKTFWFNVIMAAIGLAEGFKTIEGIDLPSWLTPTIILVGNTMLRFVTNKPVKGIK